MSALRNKLERESIPEPNSGCHLWLRAVRGHGYGVLWWEGGLVDVHRLSWAEANGPIPPGNVICHRCDVRLCINPAHLFLGTQADNLRDMALKGRASRKARAWPRGEKNRGAKLTASDVLAIRKDARSRVDIAAAYSVSYSAIARIKTRLRWGHI